jgi:hypothetical protein
MQALRGQTPRISSLKANKLIPLDKVNAHYLRLRDQLTQAALQLASTPATEPAAQALHFHSPAREARAQRPFHTVPMAASPAATNEPGRTVTSPSPTYRGTP